MLRKICLSLAVSALFAGCVTTPPSAKAPFVIAKNGVAQCRIVAATDAPPSTQYAVQELQRFLHEITGADIPVVADTVPSAAHDIIVGKNQHFDAAIRGKKGIEGLGREGYLLRNTGKHLIIAGGEPRGTLYGVYGLLEDHLGCRWFTTAVQRIPKQPNLEIGPLDERKVPVLEYREPFVLDCFDGDWAARNRSNGNSQRLEERHGGKVVYCGFVHTFNGLLPPEQYFDAHPEYFSLVKGKRLKERTQLCCTNDEVVRLVIEAVKKLMRENPQATVFSVSQNDWHNYCECEKCTALAKEEDSQMGPMLYLVNRVAKAVAKEFPDKLVDTLAYQYTRKPPKNMRPEPNVIIRLCSIECCFSHSFEACDGRDNQTFVKDVEGWSKKCKRLWVWNYDTSFANYFTPFPNLRVRKPNIRFLAAHHVTGIFEQDVYTTLNGELSELSGYLGAKLLWNPDYDENAAINEFLDAVYGKAAPSIRAYIDLIHDKVEEDNLHMEIWIGPNHPMLDGGVLEKAVQLWNEAEAAVAGDPDVLGRVQTARLSIDFAQIERMRNDGAKLYDLDHAARTLRVRPEFAALTKRFIEVAERSGVTNLSEQGGEIDRYKKELAAYQDIIAAPPAEPAQPKNTKPGLSFKGYEGTWEALPDFSKLTPKEEGLAQSIGLQVTPRREALALVFEGFFKAPEDGIYVFHCNSNDGSKLFLDGALTIDHDGLHKLSERLGIVALKKGFHSLRVEYFESGGAEGLEVSCEGPGMDKKPISAELLWHEEK